MTREEFLEGLDGLVDNFRHALEQLVREAKGRDFAKQAKVAVDKLQPSVAYAVEEVRFSLGLADDYTAEQAEPGLLFEVFLPKKMSYQVQVYDALKRGLTPTEVVKYLTPRRAAAQNRIQRLLPGKLREKYKGKLVKRMRNIQAVYSGFSMYEVDGAFAMGSPEPIVEERVQVIKLLFRPKKLYDELKKEVRSTEHHLYVMNLLREFGQLPVSLVDESSIDTFLGSKVLKEGVNRDFVRRVLQDKVVWGEDVLFFVFGYVVGKVTEIVGINEQEIWVTSYRSAVVNVVHR